ncbi:hypothetical protein PIB30_060181 [Stylosanthes scabra]|uniref:Uncharacterized protein n=1 Tax=Stylosanthes scabra TaxID=79078 RepID=A0ABU6SKW3_9FABA|nr:hypothetical protein [Stylosanthes scabra]
MRKQNVIYAEYHDGPSFSLGFSQEFNTPTPSPDGSTSEDAEVLDIPPIREILPEDIIINWKCKEYNYSSLPRFLEDFYCVEVRIMNTTITDKNLDAYHKGGTYVGMNPKLGEDGKHFDRDKAANRKWIVINSAYALLCEYCHDDGLFRASNAFNLEKKELLVLDSMHDHPLDELRRSLDKYVGRLIEDMLKIVIPTFDQKGLVSQADMPKFQSNRTIMIAAYM